MLEIGCAWSKGSGERLQGHHGPFVLVYIGEILEISLYLAIRPRDTKFCI